MSMEMPKTLQLADFSQARNLEDIKQLLAENNERLKTMYLQLWNDIKRKEWLYFTAQKKKWRLGPVGDHLCAQYFIGTNIWENWRNDALWETEWTSYGGAD